MVLVMLISNVFTDNSVKSPLQKSESGEKQPLLAESTDVTMRNTVSTFLFTYLKSRIMGMNGWNGMVGKLMAFV